MALVPVLQLRTGAGEAGNMLLRTLPAPHEWPGCPSPQPLNPQTNKQQNQKTHMSKSTLLALAAFITSLANDTGGETTATPAADAGASPEPGKKLRGRPPGTAAAPADEKPEKPTAMSREELMAIIKPLMDEGLKAEVQAEIKKFGTSLMDIPADKQAEFVANIEALKI